MFTPALAHPALKPVAGWFSGVSIGGGILTCFANIAIASLSTMAILMICWFSLLRLPVQVTIREDGLINLVGVMNRKEFPVGSIRSISSFLLFRSPPLVIVRDDRGKKYYLPTWFEKFPELISQLQSLNPSIEKEGRL
ncbi:MAG: hypothetical protein IIA00_10785 [Proteobacteria bacterium]|nr:hypothetical protein [Pseudomonadota bacterium]